MTRRPNGGPAALRRFWFEFNRSSSKKALLTPWCGVTAFTVDDAKALIVRRLFPAGLPPIGRMVEDVDVSTLDELDETHVRRHMAPPNVRGIWYPLGYEYVDDRTRSRVETESPVQEQ